MKNCPFIFAAILGTIFTSSLIAGPKSRVLSTGLTYASSNEHSWEFRSIIFRTGFLVASPTKDPKDYIGELTVTDKRCQELAENEDINFATSIITSLPFQPKKSSLCPNEGYFCGINLSN